MADFTVVRDAIITRLQTIDGLRVSDGSGVINPPAAVVAPASGTVVDYDTSSGSDDMLFVVTVLVSKASARAGQDELNAYMASSGAQSIPAAINGDLGDAAGVDYLGVEFTIRVGCS